LVFEIFDLKVAHKQTNKQTNRQTFTSTDNKGRLKLSAREPKTDAFYPSPFKGLEVPICKARFHCVKFWLEGHSNDINVWM